MNTRDLDEFEDFELFDYQADALVAAAGRPDPLRLCLYYKTGAGKSATALLAVAQRYYSEAVVVAPPSTHAKWMEWGLKFGVEVTPMSHSRFRMKGTLLSRTVPVIADEFHLFGGHTGQGWKKLDRLAQHLKAPLVLCSATPNYNDADRCYCVQHVLDWRSCKGGFLEFVYAHCNTTQNPFGMEPLVDKDHPFRNYANAAEYLSSLPGVQYLEDDLVYTIQDVPIPYLVPTEMDLYGLDLRKERIIASIIEARHAAIMVSLMEDGADRVRWQIRDVVMDIVKNASTPVLVYSTHATVAKAMDQSLADEKLKVALVHGATPAKKKQAYLDAFKDGVLDVLVGTATLATGTDGLDKVCDTLVILDDTDDDALRRQLIGRIMPRGEDTDASQKKVYRLLLS